MEGGMAKPTLEEFRRWLQTEIHEIESMEQGVVRDKRLIQLEMALQEAMAFDTAWQLRAESSIQPVVQQQSVRLVSAAPEPEAPVISGEFCTSCETEIEDDLPFCPVCGENR